MNVGELEITEMKIISTNLPEVFILKPDLYTDTRGYFTEIYRADKLNAYLGFPVDFCQENESESSKGVLRGLHYQLPPFAQSKLVRVTKGCILDVVLDIRKGSETFGQHVAVELSEENKHQLFIPRGFAHGFFVISEKARLVYKVDNYYSPEHDRGILYNDPVLDIDWGIDGYKVICSEKDLNLPLLEKAELFENGINYYE